MSLLNPDESLPCAVCGENDFLPYQCSHCSRHFCKKHLSDHPPCNKLTNRQLTDEEVAKMKQGVQVKGRPPNQVNPPRYLLTPRCQTSMECGRHFNHIKTCFPIYGNLKYGRK